MKRIAIIESDLVVNVASWDGDDPWDPGVGIILVDITDRPEVCKQWVYTGFDFTPPEAPQ